MQERVQRHAPAAVVSGGVIPMFDEVRTGLPGGIGRDARLARPGLGAVPGDAFQSAALHANSGSARGAPGSDGLREPGAQLAQVESDITLLTLNVLEELGLRAAE